MASSVGSARTTSKATFSRPQERDPLLEVIEYGYDNKSHLLQLSQRLDLDTRVRAILAPSSSSATFFIGTTFVRPAFKPLLAYGCTDGSQAYRGI